MELHSETWGHVRFSNSNDAFVEASEEENETFMLRCRFGLIKSCSLGSLLSGHKPPLTRVIFNPNTLQAVADIFHMEVETTY